MNSYAVRFFIVPLIVLCAVFPVQRATAGDFSTNADAEARLQKDGSNLYLLTRSHSYQLAQYAYGNRIGTVVVGSDIRRRLRVSNDIGAESQPTGTVMLVIRPIEASGRFGAAVASRELPGDEVRLDSPAGVAVIAYGCCAINSGTSKRTAW